MALGTPDGDMDSVDNHPFFERMLGECEGVVEAFAAGNRTAESLKEQLEWRARRMEREDGNMNSVEVTRDSDFRLAYGRSIESLRAAHGPRTEFLEKMDRTGEVVRRAKSGAVYHYNQGDIGGRDFAESERLYERLNVIKQGPDVTELDRMWMQEIDGRYMEAVQRYWGIDPDVVKGIGEIYYGTDRGALRNLLIRSARLGRGSRATEVLLKAYNDAWLDDDVRKQIVAAAQAFDRFLGVRTRALGESIYLNRDEEIGSAAVAECVALLEEIPGLCAQFEPRMLELSAGLSSELGEMFRSASNILRRCEIANHDRVTRGTDNLRALMEWGWRNGVNPFKEPGRRGSFEFFRQVGDSGQTSLTDSRRWP